jgi:hypothetical protein
MRKSKMLGIELNSKTTWLGLGAIATTILTQFGTQWLSAEAIGLIEKLVLLFCGGGLLVSKDAVD